MHRHDLTDHEWNAIRKYLPTGRSSRRGRPWKDHRTVINGILWILATGSPWRDLPERYGRWKTVYNRFRRWRDEDVWNGLMTKLLRRIDNAGKLDRSLWCVDGTVIRAHRSASGRLRQSDENDALSGLGRSRGGYSTKLHVLSDANGVVLALTATPGQSHESAEFETLMRHCPLNLRVKASRPDAIAGDKGYSSGRIRSWLRRRGIKDTIPTRSNERARARFAKKRYRRRNIIERVIGWLKESRRVATRYDKLVASYLSFVQLAALRRMIKCV